MQSENENLNTGEERAEMKKMEKMGERWVWQLLTSDETRLMRYDTLFGMKFMIQMYRCTDIQIYDIDIQICNMNMHALYMCMIT